MNDSKLIKNEVLQYQKCQECGKKMAWFTHYKDLRVCFGCWERLTEKENREKEREKKEVKK